MKYKEITLSNLNDAVEDGKKIEITKDKKVKASKLIVIKRDGTEQTYDANKMKRVVMWATNDNEYMTDDLLESVSIKLFDRIKISDVFDEVIKTSANKISLLNPDWEYVAAKLLLLKLYKESGIVSEHTYPHLNDVLDKGLQHNIYKKIFIQSFSEDDIEDFNCAIDRKRDYLFTYKGITTFNDKYCLNYSKTRKLELPQHAYMRVSMFLHYKETSDRNKKVINTYNNLSKHLYTTATPIMLNAGTRNAQLSSCVLNQVDDDTHSILDTVKNLGIYSKFKGGTALDVSRLRAKGSYILGNQGNSSGPVPFIKHVETVMKAFNQGGKRPGSCAIYFQWWHIDVEDMVVLKSNGGTEETRARGLKYSVKINDLFIDRFINDEEISLFDPKDVPELFDIVGKEFEDKYIEYENKVSVRRKKIQARDLWFDIMKERSETGNIYLFHEENVNQHNMVDRYINSSNLCAEILQPSRFSRLLAEELVIRESGDRQINKKYKAGEIALCNLASVNLLMYWKLTPKKRRKLIYDIVESMDNTIDLADYPVKEGMNSNQMYRYLGIGVNNFTNLLADQKIVIDTQEALEFTHMLFDDFSYNVISSSMQLAKERGPYKRFYDSNWAKGKCPVHFANKKAMKLTEWQPNMNKWNELGEMIARYGMRNALTMAIAPTATSGKAINATESIEPISNMLYKEEGTTNVITLVPNFRKHNKYYKRAMECDQRKLVELAAIRQIYLDQGQSVNVYFPRPDSFDEMMRVHLNGFKLGVKTYYYLKSTKGDDEEICESCT